MADDTADLLTALRVEHGEVLLRYALRHTRDREFAEDLVQEAFTRAWSRPSAVAGSAESARAWLFTVVRNLIIDDVRSARHRRELLVEPPERATSDPTDATLDRMLIADALADLSVDHRTVVVQAYYLGRTTREIADDLDIADGTVKSRLHYGVKALRIALQERGLTR